MRQERLPSCFNPSSRITTFRTSVPPTSTSTCVPCFNPSSRITTFRTQGRRRGHPSPQNQVSIPLQGLQPFGLEAARTTLEGRVSFNLSSRITTFRTTSRALKEVGGLIVSIPLQGLQPFGRKLGKALSIALVLVSIPLQGLQPFGLR